MVAIAVDMMGGDIGPSVTVPGAVSLLLDSLIDNSSFAPFSLLLVGDQTIIQQELQQLFSQHRRFNRKASELRERIQIVHAEEAIGMDEKPSTAMRTKKRSSMRIMLNLVKEGAAQAAVSAGNTGALVAISRYVLKTFPSIVRPAIVSKIPTQTGHCYMLDLGGNVDTHAEHLHQFAEMGTILSSELDHVQRPRVGLLNIGEEEIKGNEQVKQANELLQAAYWINYVGYIEADAIYSGVVDVVVCDGFVGNVALKSSEGAARFIAGIAKQEIGRFMHRKLLALLATPIWKALKKRIDPNRYNGASLVGLRGNVVKSHGGVDQEGFKSAVSVAVQEAHKDLAHLIGDRLAMLNSKNERGQRVVPERE